ncbi:16347_t:CDS:2 [Funneliformis geosporum]|nr:16347_t:CDS:2 [Funneliformis geosporum]
MNGSQEDNKHIRESPAITGNSGLQPYYHQQDPMIIQIPFYFENNNVSNLNNPLFEIYSHDNLIQNNHLNPYIQSQNNDMLSQGCSVIDFEHQNAPTTTLNDTSCPQYESEWQMPNNSNEVYPNNGITHPNMYNSVLESPFSTPNLAVMEEALSVYTIPYPMISFNETQNYNFTLNSTRPQTFTSVPPLYEEYQSCVTTNEGSPPLNSPNTHCNQKSPVYTKWTEEEDERLRNAINIYGPHKWSLIASHVPNRTPMQCSTRWLGALNPTIHKGRWTPEEDAALKEAVSEYVDLLDSDGHPQPIPWNKIASHIPHRTGIQCQARWSEALDPNVRKGKWSPNEDEVLKDGVNRYGRCWIRIAELIEGRTQRQCRTRWVQIRNKQLKLERDAIVAKNVSASSTVSVDNDEDLVMLTPPNTTPSTPYAGNASYFALKYEPNEPYRK